MSNRPKKREAPREQHKNFTMSHSSPPQTPSRSRQQQHQDDSSEAPDNTPNHHQLPLSTPSSSSSSTNITPQQQQLNSPIESDDASDTGDLSHIRIDTNDSSLEHHDLSDVFLPHGAQKQYHGSSGKTNNNNTRGDELESHDSNEEDLFSCHMVAEEEEEEQSRELELHHCDDTRGQGGDSNTNSPKNTDGGQISGNFSHSASGKRKNIDIKAVTASPASAATNQTTRKHHASTSPRNNNNNHHHQISLSPTVAQQVLNTSGPISYGKEPANHHHHQDSDISSSGSSSSGSGTGSSKREKKRQRTNAVHLSSFSTSNTSHSSSSSGSSPQHSTASSKYIISSHLSPSSSSATEPPLSLTILPDKLQLRILRFLQPTEELYPILSLSHRYHRLASNDRFWHRSYLLYRDRLAQSESLRKIRGLEKKAKKDFRKHYITLKKNRYYYANRSALKKERRTQRKCALLFATICAPIAYIIAIVFGFVLFGLYEDGYLLRKYLVVIPFLIALLVYALAVLSFLLRETVFCRSFFYDSRHMQQFTSISLAPLPHQVGILCFVIKWGLFEQEKSFKWVYAFIPVFISYWAYYCPCLGAMLFSNLKGLHRRRQYVRLKKEHAMELENAVHSDSMTFQQRNDYLGDEYDVRFKMSRLKDPDYHLGGDFYLLYFIVALCVLCIGLMTVLVPLKLDGFINNPWYVIFIPLWIMSSILMMLIPCWCLYDMLLHGDFKLLGLTILPTLISLPLFVSLILVTLSVDDISPSVPLCAGMGCFSCWLLLSAAAYIFFQSINLMYRRPGRQNLSIDAF